MSYKFLEKYRWSPNGVKILTFEKGSIHADLPLDLVLACEKEPYPLLEVVNDNPPPVGEAKAADTSEVKIELPPENKIEPAPEKKDTYPIFEKKKKKK